MAALVVVQGAAVSAFSSPTLSAPTARRDLSRRSRPALMRLDMDRPASSFSSERRGTHDGGHDAGAHGAAWMGAGEGGPPPDPSPGYWWPRATMLVCSVLYGTNFPLGRLMNEALPASATTSGRFLLAALALSPFLPRLPRSLLLPALLCGACDAVGYISQSVALLDTPAATVAFLGALTVIVCPLLGALLGGKQLGPRAAPQVWVAGALTLAGVGLLELGGEGLAVGPGDAWAVAQAVGFGSSFYATERMMRLEPEMALPITAVQCATVALLSAAWALADGYSLGPFAAAPSAGWMFDEALRAKATLPGLVLQGGPVAMALLWTGLVTTAANRIGETSALGAMGADEASVLVATEPLWAAVFGCLLLGEEMGAHAKLGGALVVIACLVSTRSPEQVRKLLPGGAKAGEGADSE